MTIASFAYAVQSAQDKLAPMPIERREPNATDVAIEILLCGICHSDIHNARNEWGGAQYPMVPGHEIVGRVTAVGEQVTKFKAGDLVGVGCLVDSCRNCAACQEGLENYCEGAATFTYGREDRIGGTKHAMTLGGYSTAITVEERFVVRMPDNLDPAAAAPLLCAGITTYSPLKHWNVGAPKNGKAQKVGIVGLGGLGHMGVKFAAAMGADVTMITTSPEKGEDAKKLGATAVLVSKDQAAMTAQANSFDFILNTIPVGHDVDPYVALLKRDGVMVIVGAVEPLTHINAGPMVFRRKTIAGSLIGGLPETQEMLDFCGQHNITCDIERIAIQDVNAAFDRTVKGDVKYRFVIDLASLAKEQALAA